MTSFRCLMWVCSSVLVFLRYFGVLLLCSASSSSEDEYFVKMSNCYSNTRTFKKIPEQIKNMMLIFSSTPTALNWNIRLEAAEEITLITSDSVIFKKENTALQNGNSSDTINNAVPTFSRQYSADSLSLFALWILSCCFVPWQIEGDTRIIFNI